MLLQNNHKEKSFGCLFYTLWFILLALTIQRHHMASTQRRGLKQIAQAGQWSVQGLQATFRYEASFRLEFYIFLIFTPISVWLAETALIWLLLFLSMVWVLVLEIINSAIEATVDMVCGEQQHNLARRAKDMGSAAVLLGQLSCLLVWLVVLYVQ